MLTVLLFLYNIISRITSSIVTIIEIITIPTDPPIIIVSLLLEITVGYNEEIPLIPHPPELI